jgi:hypothetical protein
MMASEIYRDRYQVPALIVEEEGKLVKYIISPLECELFH